MINNDAKITCGKVMAENLPYVDLEETSLINLTTILSTGNAQEGYYVPADLEYCDNTKHERKSCHFVLRTKIRYSAFHKLMKQHTQKSEE